jgi:hypothetical protein
MADPLSECRLKLLANRIGLITTQQLTQWADAEIAKHDIPPSYIIDIAMGEIPTEPQELDIVRNTIRPSECAEIMRILEAKFDDGTIDLDSLGTHCYSLSQVATGRVSDLLDWISDEIYLCGEHIKAIETSLPQIRAAIKEIYDNGT